MAKTKKHLFREYKDEKTKPKLSKYAIKKRNRLYD